MRENRAAMDFEAMKTAKVEGLRPYHVDHWCPDVEEHIAQVRREFARQPELCAFHAELIVRIRRACDLQGDLATFFALWREQADFLTENLDSRWLISALDSFIDHGKPQEQACAMAIVGFMNMAMLAETEYRLCGAVPYQQAKITENIDVYPHIWDGRRVFHINGDDTFAKTVGRLRRVFAEQSTLMKIFETLLKIMFEGESLLSRLAPHHPRGLW